MSSLVQYFINVRSCQSLVLIGRRKCGKTTLVKYILNHVPGNHRVVHIYGEMDALKFINGPHDKHAIVVMDDLSYHERKLQTAMRLLVDNPARFNCFVIATSAYQLNGPWLRCVFNDNDDTIHHQFDLLNENGQTIDQDDSVPASFLNKKIVVY